MVQPLYVSNLRDCTFVSFKIKKNYYDTNELIYKTEVDSQTQKTDLWLPKGKGWEGINWEFGINRYTPLYIKYINNKDLLYSTGNSAQYYVTI